MRFVKLPLSSSRCAPCRALRRHRASSLNMHSFLCYWCGYSAVVRSTLGAAVADQMLGEHSQVKTMLATLDTMAANDPSFDMQLRGSMDAMIAHMQVGWRRPIAAASMSGACVWDVRCRDSAALL
eukprot:GHRQ01036076.1.p3 GENE.GHRQ01036076.1~~GHRQ01036076.1.p3  ORF type:complete len:125 (-),score=30.36 GHRQ01036076.1:178-552(-)